MTPQQLKQARIDAGLSQDDFARELAKYGRTTQYSVRRWESLESFTPTVEANVRLRVEAWQAARNQ